MLWSARRSRLAAACLSVFAARSRRAAASRGRSPSASRPAAPLRARVSVVGMRRSRRMLPTLALRRFAVAADAPRRLSAAAVLRRAVAPVARPLRGRRPGSADPLPAVAVAGPDATSRPLAGRRPAAGCLGARLQSSASHSAPGSAVPAYAPHAAETGRLADSPSAAARSLAFCPAGRHRMLRGLARGLPAARSRTACGGGWRPPRAAAPDPSKST